MRKALRSHSRIRKSIFDRWQSHQHGLLFAAEHQGDQVSINHGEWLGVIECLFCKEYIS